MKLLVAYLRLIVFFAFSAVMLTGIMVFYCLFLILLNLVVDIAYGILDPRIREGRR